MFIQTLYTARTTNLTLVKKENRLAVQVILGMGFAKNPRVLRLT